MFGYTTKQDVGNGCATSRSNRHQIGTQASGNCSDFSTCLPVPHFSPDRFTPPINTPHENLHLLARLLRYLTLVTYDSRSCDASAPEHSFKPLNRYARHEIPPAAQAAEQVAARAGNGRRNPLPPIPDGMNVEPPA